MHSSRMRTVCSSSRLLPGGCVCFRGGCVCFLVGVCFLGGVYPSMHWGRHPPVDRMTDRCKNITFPQIRLRTVKICARKGGPISDIYNMALWIQKRVAQSLFYPMSSFQFFGSRLSPAFSSTDTFQNLHSILWVKAVFCQSISRIDLSQFEK